MKIAVVGTSLITEKFIDAARMCNGIEVAAVCSRTKEKAAMFGDKFDIPLRFTDLNELAGSPVIDAVYVASPNSFHCEQSVLMMQSGKHVFCEKPIAVSADEFSRMLNVASDAGVVLLEASKHIFSPGIKTIQSTLPEIGSVRRAAFEFNQYSSRYDRLKQGEDSNIFSKELAGGALYDLGVYCVQLMVALWGKPASVVGSSYILRTGVDGLGSAIVDYDGFIVELSYSKITESATPSVIQGENGSIVFDNLSRIEKIDVIKRKSYSALDNLSRSEEKDAAAREKGRRQIDCNAVENQMVYETQAFIDMVKSPEKAKPYNEISMISLEIMDTLKKWN